MISFFAEDVEPIEQEAHLTHWISSILINEGYQSEALNFILCNDAYLLDINVKYLKHNYLTDVISFNYGLGKMLSGDIYISVDRVKDNSLKFKSSFHDELHRVMAHGVLHFCGYNDKSEEEVVEMRAKEDYYLSLRTF